VILNVLMFVWWLACVEQMPPQAVLHVCVMAALIASAVGLPAASAAWELTLSAQQRTAWIAVSATLAVAAVASLWWLSMNEALRPLCAALIVAAVVAQRHVAMMLSKRQQELRFGWMLLGFIALIALTAQQRPELVARGPALAGFGTLWATTAFVCVLLAAWNAYRGRIAAYRDDPLHDSLQW
jgi:hypothetical protein